MHGFQIFRLIVGVVLVALSQFSQDLDSQTALACLAVGAALLVDLAWNFVAAKRRATNGR